jgi:hypothetical protein
MGGTHSSFRNDDFPSLDYDVLQIRDPWNAVSLWQNSQFTFECHFLLLSGLNWLIRKWSRIWSLESPGQRACNISLSQKADSNNLNPQLKTHSHFTIQIHVTTNILFHTASKELVATLLWVKQGCLRYWLLLGSKSISNGAQYVTSDNKIYCKNVKMCRFSSGNWFFCTKIVQLPMAGNGRNTFVRLKKRVYKLDLIVAQYFWLVDHNDWSRWFAISSCHIYVVPITVLLMGLRKIKAKLRHLILLSRVTYWEPVEML